MLFFSIIVPVSQFEFDRIDLAIISLLVNQPVVSEPERARDLFQSATITAVQSEFFVLVSCLQTLN